MKFKIPGINNKNGITSKIINTIRSIEKILLNIFFLVFNFLFFLFIFIISIKLYIAHISPIINKIVITINNLLKNLQIFYHLLFLEMVNTFL